MPTNDTPRRGATGRAGTVGETNDSVPVTRAAVEAFLSTLDPDGPRPRWCTHPATETQFAAALIARLPGVVTPVYDEQDRLIILRGIRLKAGAR
jgi:hypothetical protein